MSPLLPEYSLEYLLKFVRNVEQDKTTCHVQKGPILASYFWSFLPLFAFEIDFVSSLYFNIYPLEKFDDIWYLVEMLCRTRRRVRYKNDTSAFLTFVIISFCYI